MSIALQGNGFANQIKSTPASTPAFRQGWIDIRPSVFDDSFPRDIFQPQVNTNVEQKAEAPKIGIFRVLFHRLTKDQIAEVNESRQLPKNAKIVDGEVSGEPKLTWNALDWTKGTHTLPTGYEMKQDILGFTHVVREDSKAWWLKKDN